MMERLYAFLMYEQVYLENVSILPMNTFNFYIHNDSKARRIGLHNPIRKN